MGFYADLNTIIRRNYHRQWEFTQREQFPLWADTQAETILQAELTNLNYPPLPSMIMGVYGYQKIYTPNANQFELRLKSLCQQLVFSYQPLFKAYLRDYEDSYLIDNRIDEEGNKNITNHHDKTNDSTTDLNEDTTKNSTTDTINQTILDGNIDTTKHSTTDTTNKTTLDGNVDTTQHQESDGTSEFVGKLLKDEQKQGAETITGTTSNMNYFSDTAQANVSGGVWTDFNYLTNASKDDGTSSSNSNSQDSGSVQQNDTSTTTTHSELDATGNQKTDDVTDFTGNVVTDETGNQKTDDTTDFTGNVKYDETGNKVDNTVFNANEVLDGNQDETFENHKVAQLANIKDNILKEQQIFNDFLTEFIGRFSDLCFNLVDCDEEDYSNV